MRKSSFGLLASFVLILFLTSGCGNNNKSSGPKQPIKPDTGSYIPIEIEASSLALTNDGVNIIYATQSGEIYALDMNNKTSDYLDEVGGEVNGIAYINADSYYYSMPKAIYRLALNSATALIASVPFPDGLDYYNGYIYSVTNDASGILTVLDQNGNTIKTLDSGIPDITGITHSSKYLYVLAESGDIYQTDFTTGSSRVILQNNNLFEGDNADGGLEGITLLGGYLYVSNSSENKIYKIDVNIRNFE